MFSEFDGICYSFVHLLAVCSFDLEKGFIMPFNKYADEICEVIQQQYGEPACVLDQNGMILNTLPSASNLLPPQKLLDSLEPSRLIRIPREDEPPVYIYFESPQDEERIRSVSAFASMLVSMDAFVKKHSRKRREEAAMVRRLLSDEATRYADDIKMAAADLGYNIVHPMSVIVARVELQSNYCLNMDLGYEGAASEASANILDEIRNHQFINKQDIAAFIDNNYLVVIKAIENTTDLPRLYRMQFELEKALDTILNSYHIFSYWISAGQIAETFSDAHASFMEATENISFAKLLNIDHTIIVEEDILFHKILSHLPKEYSINMIQSRVQSLFKENRETILSLTQCYDSFLDHSFNIASTAEALYLHRNTVTKRLEKLYALTGLNPARSFQDALNIKFILQQYWLGIRQEESGI